MKLLFAEDDRDLSTAVRTLLERNGYMVDAVYDGAEAVDYALEGEYDGMIPADGKEDYLAAASAVSTNGTVRYYVVLLKTEKLAFRLPLINGDLLTVSAPLSEINASWELRSECRSLKRSIPITISCRLSRLEYNTVGTSW